MFPHESSAKELTNIGSWLPTLTEMIGARIPEQGQEYGSIAAMGSTWSGALRSRASTNSLRNAGG
jgi:hypothetical protein